MLDAPIVDCGWFMGTLKGVQVTYMDGRLTDDAFQRYLRTLAKEIDDQTVRGGVFYDVPEPASMTAKRRKALAEALEHRKARVREMTLGYVMVTPSPLVRGILTAVFWLAPPPYETKVTGSAAEGWRWLATRCPGLDVQSACDGYLWLRQHCLQQMGERFPAT